MAEETPPGASWSPGSAPPLWLCSLPLLQIVPQPSGYWESHPWHATAEQTLTKSGAPEHILLASSQSPEEAEKLLDLEELCRSGPSLTERGGLLCS